MLQRSGAARRHTGSRTATRVAMAMMVAMATGEEAAATEAGCTDVQGAMPGFPAKRPHQPRNQGGMAVAAPPSASMLIRRSLLLIPALSAFSMAHFS